MDLKIDYLDYDIDIYNSKKTNLPILIYINFNKEVSSLIDNLTDYNLINITKKDIVDYLTPYPYDNFLGKADYLINDLDKIIKLIKDIDNFKNSKIYLLGYSLAGLFCVYSSYKINSINGIVSCSASLWYPNFMNFINEHKVSNNIEKAYFSVGDKENKGMKGLVKDVITNTKKTSQIFAKNKVNSYFELNEGNHFKDVDIRIMKGILWIVKKI